MAGVGAGVVVVEEGFGVLRRVEGVVSLDGDVSFGCRDLSADPCPAEEDARGLSVRPERVGNFDGVVAFNFGKTGPGALVWVNAAFMLVSLCERVEGSILLPAMFTCDFPVAVWASVADVPCVGSDGGGG